MSKVNILDSIKSVWDWLIRRETEILRNADWIETYEAKYVALALASLSLIFSFTHIFRHLKQYTMPEIQVYVIRIILTCPIYATSSAIAMFVGPYALYAETFRDLFEAIVVYSFFNLILEYGGGETDLVYAIENDGLLKLPWPLCCLKSVPRNARFDLEDSKYFLLIDLSVILVFRLLRFCHQGVLQFIMIKPCMAILDVIFISTGLYYQPAWQVIKMLIYNISYAWALYCLFVFYLAVKKVISQFRPIAKFTTVKMIIFATYYQSLVLQLTLAKPNTAVDWNNMLLIAEMVIFSIAFMFAFPVKEFEGGIPHRSVLRNAQDVFNVRDIVQNIYHNFMPEYSDYALQKCQQEIPSTIHEPVYMSGNLSRVAKEMAERYRGRSAKKSFNELLRGSNPITAKIRKSRQMQSFRSDSSHSSGDAAVGDEESLIGDHAKHDQKSVYNDLHLRTKHKAKIEKGGEEKEYLELRDLDHHYEEDKSHLGKIALHIKQKVALVAPNIPSGNPAHRPHAVFLSSNESSQSLGGFGEDDEIVCDFAMFPSKDIGGDEQLVGFRSPLNKENIVNDNEIDFSSPKQQVEASVSTSLDVHVLHSPSLEWSEYA